MNQPAFKSFLPHTFLLWPACIGIIAGIATYHNVPTHYVPFVLITTLLSMVGEIGFRWYKSLAKLSFAHYMAPLFFCLGITSCFIQANQFTQQSQQLMQQKWIKGTVTAHLPTATGSFAYKTEIALPYRSWWQRYVGPTYTAMLFHSDDSIAEQQRLIFHRKHLTENKQLSGSSYRYALKQHRLANAFMYQKTGVIKEPAPTDGLFAQVRDGLDTAFSDRMSPQTYLIYASIFLGKKIPETERWLRDLCARWGISHFLARSGLHLVIFLFVCHLILLMFPLNLQTRTGIALVLLLLYNALTWQSISFTRALVVSILFCLALLTKRQGIFVHLLSLVFLAILITNPAQLFALDFQLTFALTFALSLGVNRFSSIIKNRTIAAK